MTQNCKIIRDLLPLYLDDVCSDASRALVEEHLGGCVECALLLEKMKDTEPSASLKQEQQTAVTRHAAKQRKRSVIAGSITAGILLVPVLICLIVNLATGHGLDWFFLVLTSLMLTASVTVVPLLMPQNKGLWTLGAGTACLLLLLGVCCIYTKGDWFPVAASASLFGLSVVLLPFAVHAEPIRRKVGDQKALVCFAADTVLFAAMMVCIGLKMPSPAAYLYEAFAIAFPFVLLAWLLFAVIRYLPCKAGICIILTGLFGFLADAPYRLLTGRTAVFPPCDLLHWNWQTVDGNIRLCCLLGALVLGTVFILAYLLRRKRGNKA